GRPRKFENPEAKIEDNKDAASALLADDKLTGLPLFGLGICFGAGPMVRSVAEDSRFRPSRVLRRVHPQRQNEGEDGDAYQATFDGPASPDAPRVCSMPRRYQWVWPRPSWCRQQRPPQPGVGGVGVVVRA